MNVIINIKEYPNNIKDKEQLIYFIK